MLNQRKVPDADMRTGEAVTITLPELSHALRVTTQQVHRMLSDGRMYPADVTLGGRRGNRWLRSRFQQWLEAGCPRAETWAAAG